MSPVATILCSIVGGTITAEFRNWAPAVARACVRVAASWSAPGLQDRLHEEWSAHLEEIPGELGKLIVGIGFLLASLRMVSPTTGLSRIDMWRSMLVRTRRVGAPLRAGRQTDPRPRWQRIASPVAITLLVILMFASGAHKDLANAVSKIARGDGDETDWMVVVAAAMIVALYLNERRKRRAEAQQPSA